MISVEPIARSGATSDTDVISLASSSAMNSAPTRTRWQHLRDVAGEWIAPFGYQDDQGFHYGVEPV
jgi:hypothetical protein